MSYHATRKAALARLGRDGFEYERAPIMGDSVYRHADGRYAWIDEARFQSFDRHGKHWFMVQVRQSRRSSERLAA